MNAENIIRSFFEYVSEQGAIDLLHDDEAREELIEDWIKDSSKKVSKGKTFRKATAKQSVDWEDFVNDCGSILEDILSLPEKCNARHNWYGVVSGMMTWAEEHEHATPAMRGTLDNIMSGVDKWSR